MATKILLLENNITLEYDDENEWIYANWKGDQNYLSVQDGCEKILYYLRQERCSKVLNDNSNVTSIWSEASEWVGKEWFPRMAEAGLKYFAWVYSSNIFSQFSTDLVLTLNPKVTIITFTDKETAAHWLMKM